MITEMKYLLGKSLQRGHFREREKEKCHFEGLYLYPLTKATQKGNNAEGTK